MNASPGPLAALAPHLLAIAGDAPRHDREASFPAQSIARLHQAGILALTVPAGLGGGGAGLRLAAQAVQRVGQACSATALILAMQLSRQAALARSPAWPAALRERLGREAVAQGALINALRVEPELGSPSRGGLPATVARFTGTQWRIRGHKRYATGAPGLSWLEVHARTEEPSPRIGSFLVPAGAPGIEIRETWNHLGLRGSASHDVLLHDVAIPAEHAIGLVAADPPPPPDPVQMAWNAVLIGAVYTGVARAARAAVVAFLRGRIPAGLGAPLASLPRVQEAVGAIDGLLAANARIIEALAVATDGGETPHRAESGLHKATLAENAVRAVERAVGLAGNHGHDRALPLERHWRDVQCARVHVPTEDAAHLAAGRRALEDAA